MNSTVRSIRNFFVSLKLTVVLLGCSMVLVFAATLAQVDLGIYAVQEEFFHSWVAIWHVWKLYVPLPGGYLVGGLLLINLIAAHVYRLKFTWGKLGIQLTHAGLIVLLIGELLTGLWQEDYSMSIVEGGSKNYAESFRLNELAIVDTSDPQFDDVVVIPDTFIAAGKEVQHPKLPFRVVTKLYQPNSEIQPRAQAQNPPEPIATQGDLERRFVYKPQALSYRPDERNVPFAVIELIGAEGSLGTWFVATDIVALRRAPDGTPIPVHAPAPTQHFDYGGRHFDISLRPTRVYKPFSLQLLEIKHDLYVGTDIPKNYSSRVKLTTPDGRDDREVLIYMNNPMRYGGETYYQYQMDTPESKTVLQVVRNPSWILPYIACIMMGGGLVLQFGLSLIKFVGQRRAKTTSAAA